MDKLVADGRRATISNDGATIMKLLEVEHPAAKTLVDISMSQDAEVGDGTTSVVLLAVEILSQMKPFIEEGVHPQIIIRHIRSAASLAVARVRSLAVHFDLSTPEGEQMLVPGGLDDLPGMIGIKKIPGGDVRQSFLVRGVAFKKTFSYAGFEQMTKSFVHPKILLLNVELELKNEKENAEVRIEDPAEYQSIVDAEWQVIYDKLDSCVNCDANIVLSKLPIGDLATQYFADRGLFCAGRVEEGDLRRVAKATGATVQTSTNGFFEGVLGTCENFEEKQVGDERFNLFTGCPHSLTSTMVLRGGSEQFIAESERSIHDALMVVKHSLKSGSVVAGGGAVELEVARHLRDHALSIEGKGQLIIAAFARALEVVPRQLCDNAGFDPNDILSALRRKYAKDADGTWYGVDIEEGGILDAFAAGIWEPSDNKANSLASAAEAAGVILSIDETVINPRSQDPGAATGMMGVGHGCSQRPKRRK